MVLKENLTDIRFVLNIPKGTLINPSLPSDPVIFDYPLAPATRSEYERTNYIVGIYNSILQQITDDIVFILEEDVWAEQGFLDKIINPVLEGLPIISGVYNFRDSDFDNICLYDLVQIEQGEKPVNYREDNKPKQVCKCFVGSTGLMAIKTSVLKEVNYLRCEKVVLQGFEDQPYCVGWDICLGHDLNNKGIPFYADPTIKTFHGGQ